MSAGSVFHRFDEFLNAGRSSVCVRVIKAKGSAPRDEGAFMLVSKTALFGTIGGGALEYDAITQARKILDGLIEPGLLSFALGPRTGQCCGGNVRVEFLRVDEACVHMLRAQLRVQKSNDPHVYIFGAGHVGAALVDALEVLPFQLHLVETRPHLIDAISTSAQKHITAMPETIVENAPRGSLFVLLSHDHGLDFLIGSAALKRGDGAYVGMIGSKSKRQVFHNWFIEHGGLEEQFAKLTMPIGTAKLKDKRPCVIAALVAAELLQVSF